MRHRLAPAPGMRIRSALVMRSWPERVVRIGPALVVLIALALGAANPAAADIARATAAAATTPMPQIAILCYHDISSAAGTPLQTVSPEFLRAQIRACRDAGWTFVPLRRVIELRDHPERLPARTLVLTFDDGYRSFRDAALPVLRDEGVPATLAVISSFVDHPPLDLPPLLGWEELKALEADTLVDIASHTHDLHRYETSDPYKDTAPSAATRRYLLAQGRYENRDEYRARIRADLTAARQTLHDRLGVAPAALVWPYGMSNEMSRGIAETTGFLLTLSLGGREVTRDDLRSGCLPRVMVTRTLRFTRGDLSWLRPVPPAMRAAQVDLDALYDPDPAVFASRVDQLVRRVREIGATHVFLEACSDPAGDGRIRAAWFTNHQVFVRADVWGMVASRLAQARVRVWARVPTMNLTWAWQQHPEWRIGEASAAPARRGATVTPDATVVHTLAAWPTRLSPDLPEARRAAIDFITDLAVYAPIDGVLFDDDAFMAPGERLALSRSMDPATRSDTIEELLAACRTAVRSWRPDCAFGRNVSAAVVETDGVHAGLSQDFGRISRDDGLAVIMAYPQASGHAADATRWVEGLGRRAVTRWAAAQRGTPGAGRGRNAACPAPVLLKLQTYDWNADRWIPASRLGEQMAALRRVGISNFGLYPVTATDGDLPARLFDRTELPQVPMAGETGP